MKKQIAQVNWQVKVLDESNRIIEMIGSTEQLDRADDKMFMSGARIENYLKNPVIIANHCYGYTEKPTVIGKSLEVRIVGSQMIFKIQFAETENAKDWYYLYANGYMNASSIGFIPIKYNHNDAGGYDFMEWELLELSMVAVPCNPGAVQRAFESGNISKSVFELIKQESEDVLSMKMEEVQALINTSVTEAMKGVNAQHEVDLKAKEEEIKTLEAEIKSLEGQVTKSGSKFSKETADSITKACDGIGEHIKSLKSLVSPEPEDDDSNSDDEGEESKEYTPEELSKMIADNVQKQIEKFSK